VLSTLKRLLIEKQHDIKSKIYVLVPNTTMINLAIEKDEMLLCSHLDILVTLLSTVTARIR